MPSIEEFADKHSEVGIDEHTTVIAYDSQAGANAARLWWLLNYVGHEKVYILDGGFPALEREWTTDNNGNSCCYTKNIQSKHTRSYACNDGNS